MDSKTKIGIIICDRYRRCAGGKCFRAMRNKEGAFSIYTGIEVELVGFTSCDGCPGGNIEYAGEEMVHKLFIWLPAWWWVILPVPILIHLKISLKNDMRSRWLSVPTLYRKNILICILILGHGRTLHGNHLSRRP